MKLSIVSEVKDFSGILEIAVAVLNDGPARVYQFQINDTRTYFRFMGMYKKGTKSHRAALALLRKEAREVETQ